MLILVTRTERRHPEKRKINVNLSRRREIGGQIDSVKWTPLLVELTNLRRRITREIRCGFASAIADGYRDANERRDSDLEWNHFSNRRQRARMDGRGWRAAEKREEKDRDKTGEARAADDFIKRALLAALFGKIM